MDVPKQLTQLNQEASRLRENADKAWDFHVSIAEPELKASWLTRWQQLHSELQALDNRRALLEARLTSGNDEYNTGALLYSKTLAENLNMRAPYDQYGLYLSAVSAGGLALWQARRGVRAMARARELGRAAFLKEQGRPKVEWMNHVAEADATEVQLLKASNFISRQKATANSSFVAAVASALLWLSYVAYCCMSVQGAHESQQAQPSRAIKK